MSRYRKYFFLLAFAALLRPLGAQSNINGTWTAEIRQGKVFLQVRTSAPREASDDRWRGDWNMGQSIPIEEVAGLPANDEQFTVSNVKFELRREAGTLAFDGAFRDGRGAGLFTFAPRNEYAGEMRSLGYTDDLPIWRRFQLAVHDVGPRYIRALKTEGFDTVSLDLVQRAKNHGVTIDYIRELKAQGFGATTIEDLVRARDHGVTPDYVKEIKNLGYNVSGLDQYVRMRDHGVRAEFVRALNGQGFKNLPIEEVVRARDHGVTAEYIADMKDLGLRELSLSEIVRLRDHGITPGFVNHVRARGYKPADAEDLVRLKNRGLRE